MLSPGRHIVMMKRIINTSYASETPGQQKRYESGREERGKCAGREFMPQSGQKYTARRFQSFNTETTPPRYDAGFECEPPPNVRTELNHQNGRAFSGAETGRTQVVGKNSGSPHGAARGAHRDPAQVAVTRPTGSFVPFTMISRWTNDSATELKLAGRP